MGWHVCNRTHLGVNDDVVMPLDTLVKKNKYVTPLGMCKQKQFMRIFQPTQFYVIWLFSKVLLSSGL